MQMESVDIYHGITPYNLAMTIFLTIFLIGIFTISALLIIYLLRQSLLRRVGSFLISEEPEVETYDAIIIMNGNISTRPFRAAELYKQRPAPIIIARLADTEEVRMGVIPNISEATRSLLEKLGIPSQDIHLLNSERWVSGTWGEAIMLCKCIRENGYKNITIVTDAFHTRRAAWTFRKIMQNNDVQFSCHITHYSKNLESQWWRSEFGLIQVINEYLKFIHYRRLAKTIRPNISPTESELPMADEVRAQIHVRADDP